MANDSPRSRTIRPDEYYNTVHVGDYYDKVHRTTWARRTSGLLTGATLGIMYGGAIGVLGAFLPHLLYACGVAGASAVAGAAFFPALVAIGTSAALCAGVGAFLGIAITADVAVNSSSIAAGLEEMEKRHKVERLQDGMAALQDLPAAPKESPSPLPPKLPSLFSWKVAIITIPLFAAFGALVSLAPFAAPAVMALGFPAVTVATAGAHLATILASASMFGMFGAVLGFKNSLTTNKLGNFYFKVLTEQYFQKHPQKTVSPEKEAEPAQVPAGAPEAASRETAMEAPATSFADKAKRVSLAELIAQREAPAAERQDIAPTR